jgi:signal transduction histidine kinase
MELHLFRIVQEACENAQRHGHPQSITITGRLEARRLDLLIEDDGEGFTPNQNLEELLIHKHYGLAGMIERASLIGGQVTIDSTLQNGTRVRVSWEQV